MQAKGTKTPSFLRQLKIWSRRPYQQSVDTTAFSMTNMIYYLLKYPSTLQKLREELEDAVGRGQLSNPPTYSEAEKLKYLSAVMKEAMRSRLPP